MVGPPPDRTTFPQRPLGLTLLTWLFGFWCGAAALTLIALYAGEADVLVDGAPTPRPLVREMLMPMLVPMALATGAAAGTLWLDSPWARPTALFAILIAGPLATFPRWAEATNPGGAPLIGLLAVTPLLLALGWYLYGKPNVAAYYRALTDARREGRTPIIADRADYDPDHDPRASIPCEVCGGVMAYTAACKLKCGRCGYARDCSDP